MESVRFHFLFANFVYCVLVHELLLFVVYYNKYIF